jgi:molybdopterin converting factor small subunit
MPKIFMPEEKPEERLRILQINADKVETTTYEKELTEDELIAKREEFVDNSIVVSKLEDELAEKKKEFKNKIEPVKLVNRALQQEIKTKKKEVKGLLFQMADQVNSMMEVYDETGELVSSRRLRPEEKQTRLQAVPPKVANGE